MKLRDFFYMLGLRPKARSYGHQIKEQIIDGKSIRYADWLHPRANSCAIKQPEVDRLKGILAEGDVAIDIGAGIGDSALPMAVAVGQTGHVIAFEADPKSAAVLAVNAGLNKNIGTLHAHNLAVTDENRKYESSYNDQGFMNGGAVESTQGFRRGDVFRMEVDGVHLESFLDKQYPHLVSRIKFIKIAAEKGYGYYILQSMSSLLDRIRPVIQAEVIEGTTARYRTQIFEFLRSKGYAVQCENSHNLEVIETAAGMLKLKKFGLCCTPVEQMARRRMTA